MTENATNLRGKVLSGLFWKALENGGVQLVQLVISLILARLLGPERYGTISLLLVFIAIANVFIQTGFQTSLIQKKQVDDLDYSSVFYLSLGVATALYALIFAAAPAVAGFYHDPELKGMLRVLALMIFLEQSCRFRRLLFPEKWNSGRCALPVYWLLVCLERLA